MKSRGHLRFARRTSVALLSAFWGATLLFGQGPVRRTVHISVRPGDRPIPLLEVFAVPSLQGALVGPQNQSEHLLPVVPPNAEQLNAVLSKVSEQEKTSGKLQADIVKALQQQGVDYLILVRYLARDDVVVRVNAVLMKTAENRIVWGDEIDLRREDPDFKVLGRYLVDAILKAEGKPLTRRARPLLFCGFSAKGGEQPEQNRILRTVRSTVVSRFRSYERLWNISTIDSREGICQPSPKESAVRGSQGAFRADGSIEVGDMVDIELKVECEDKEVASVFKRLKREELLKTDCSKQLHELSDELMNQCEKWVR